MTALSEAKSLLLPRDSAHELCTRDSERDSFHGTLELELFSNKERIFSLFLLRTLPHARRDSCPRDPPPAQHGWEGVVDVTAGFFFLFAEEGEGRLHCSLPNY